jgi:hypothetical protein
MCGGSRTFIRPMGGFHHGLARVFIERSDWFPLHQQRNFPFSLHRHFTIHWDM